MAYGPTVSAQENEFTQVNAIFAEAQALIAAGEFHNAASRIGHALAAA